VVLTTRSHHRQGIAKRDKAQAALRLYTVAPLRETSVVASWQRQTTCVHPLSSKSLLSKIEERLAEFYDIDGIELGNGEMVIHRLDIPSCGELNEGYWIVIRISTRLCHRQRQPRQAARLVVQPANAQCS
jgi:hypothetical protein